MPQNEPPPDPDAAGLIPDRPLFPGDFELARAYIRTRVVILRLAQRLADD